MSSRPRNMQQLISEWVSLTHAQHARERHRGYDASHVQDEIDRERLLAEAKAAAALATQYIASDRVAPSAS